MKIKNKILIMIIFIFALFLFFNIKNVNASFDITYNDVKYSLPDLPSDVADKHFIIVCEGTPSVDKDVILFYNTKPYKYYQECSNYYSQYKADCIPVGFEPLSYVYTPSGTSGWVSKQFSYRFHGVTGFNINWYTLIYSNNDILIYKSEKDNSTEVLGTFFQLPVTEIPETIPALETVEQIPTAMVETLKMIIPVGLVVLSAVLLIYLTKSVISRMT